MPRIDRMVPRDQLKPNPRNARTHSRKQIREIANSIAAFGFTAPIITDESGFILAGHGRFAAAELLGFPEVPVVELHGLTISSAPFRSEAISSNGHGSKRTKTSPSCCRAIASS
jgi:ParB-like chromosome segregation protein Spo0J